MASETCRHRDGKRGSESRVNEIKKKKTWNDFSTGQKVAMIVLGLIQLTLLVAAQRDIGKRRDSEINGSRGMWRALAFINWVGPISWFAFGRKR
jgi:hypothetical protein